MKKINNLKFNLKKSTISNLKNFQMSKLMGGEVNDSQSDNACPTGTGTPTQFRTCKSEVGIVQTANCIPTGANNTISFQNPTNTCPIASLGC